MDYRLLPLTKELFEEALSKAFDYVMKRENQFRYIVRYAKAQQRYIEHVQDCIKDGRMPMTWQLYINRERIQGEPE